MTPGAQGESFVLVPFGDRFLWLTCEEFKAALERGRVLDGITATPSGANGDAPERLLTAEGMEELTEVPATWFLEQARLGQIPHIKLGKYSRFLLSQVLEHGAVMPPTEAGGTWARKKKRGAGAGPS